MRKENWNKDPQKPLETRKMNHARVNRGRNETNLA